MNMKAQSALQAFVGFVPNLNLRDAEIDSLVAFITRK